MTEMTDITSDSSADRLTRPLQDLIATRMGRRRMLAGGLGMAAAGLFGTLLPGCDRDSKKSGDASPEAPRNGAMPLTPPEVALLGFASVPAIFDKSFDGVMLAEGYRYQTLFAWGDPVTSGATSWKKDGSNTAEELERLAGQSHDGMIFYPFPEETDHGLLVMNHESAEPSTLHPQGPTVDAEGRRPLPEVRKEQVVHGVSVIEIRRSKGGAWDVVPDSRWGRRIHMNTPMHVSGPAAAHPRMRTSGDPDGKVVLGTLNNCASSRTPWGTYLTCEENFQNYFANPNAADLKSRPQLQRYGVLEKSELQWETTDPRFNLSPSSDPTVLGYGNEVNRFGWVVEIDPFNPQSTPVKRTAMGRFSHENCECLQDAAGNLAFYMGDDSRGEYLYKFVPKGAFQANDAAANGQLLDNGTLYVGLFHEDGTGEWLELTHGKNGLNRINGFADQGEVVIHARAAADHVGATPMDRPEWVAVSPKTGEIFVTLTNNKNRGTDNGRQAINAVNPREKNLYGHIIKLAEEGNNPRSLTFRWDIFVLCGDPNASAANLKGNIQGDIFGSPDGLAFDRTGRLWIQTDYDDAAAENQALGLNQMLAADPKTQEIRRFMVGPRGCEITGIAFNPAHTSMFVNIQHPTLSFPASDGQTRPRSATVVVTRDDGGEIGT
ncbi:MAG TPA: PhoX family phosphatase [Oligoflexus sp.]|uniref:PhoX family protein n=1 Tax=Oligoflexus sp. TaxID=1971216 RepID=UPI002D5E1041|nr:PhoX family phosphatase [Oligoflexus sp.]HYX36243.1 PhoX family phosphatase [Oligoflexus sp.]